MSGPYTEVTQPLGLKHFTCNICGIDFLTKQFMWTHQEKKHPEEIKKWEDNHNVQKIS